MKSLKKFIPQFSELFFIGMFIYIFIFRTYGILNSDTDMLWHIRQGEWLIDNHKIVIDKEIFSYLFDTNNWKYLSWLSDIMYAAMYRMWGIGSIIIMTELVITGTIYMIFRYLCKKGIPVWISFPIMIVFMHFYSYHWLPRAAIFSYFFTALWFIVIDNYYSENKKKMLYFLPLIQVIWTNLHSSFMYGYIIFFFFGISALIERFIYEKKEKLKIFINLFLIGSLTLLASIVNPYGITYFTELNSEAREFFSERVSEFLSVNLHNMIIGNFYFVIMLFLLLIWGKKEKPVYILLLIFWQYSGFEYVRHMALFGIMVMLILPQLIKYPDNIKNRYLRFVDRISIKIINKEKTRYSIVVILAVILIFIGFGIRKEITDKLKISYKIDNIRFPVKAMEYLKKNPIEGRCFNDYFAGGYMIWEFYPKRVVSMDPRATVYPMNIVLDNYHVFDFGDYTFKILEERDVKWLLIATDSFLAKGLKDRSDIAEEKYSDKMYVIYKLKQGKKWTDSIEKENINKEEK